MVTTNNISFKPDSEDQWTSEKPGKKRMKDILEEEPDQWNLSLDWLKDSATFNEWMVILHLNLE